MYLGLWEQRAVSAIVDCKLENESDLSMLFGPPPTWKGSGELNLWTVEFAAGIPLWMCRYSTGYGAMRTLGHVVNILLHFLHFLLWFPRRTLGQLWTCKNRFAFRFDFGVKYCCIFFFFTSFFCFVFSLRFCMLFYVNKFSFLFCFWFWCWC